MEKLRVLDLFSGIGGFSLGLERTGGFETVAFCEIEEFPRKVLAKHWPDVPCLTDVRKITKGDVDGPIDVICGGYPCQPFSTAGKRAGEKDDRHLWPEVNRLLDVFRPSWFIGENVAGHISMGLDSVLSDLENTGYASRVFLIPACAVDAKHRRDRIWIVANSDSRRRGEQEERQGQQPGRAETKRSSEDVAHPQGERRRKTGQPEQRPSIGSAGTSPTPGHVAHTKSISGGPGCGEAGSIGNRHVFADSGQIDDQGWITWPVEPDVGRVANGVPNRVDRLKALGNAVVPQIPEMIGHAILEAEGR
jgi:DNA (cytosine-5)-methyltransferase 1